MKKHSVAVFASGNGTNAINLIQSFQANSEISIDLVLCNKSDAPVVEKSKALGVEVLIFSNEAFESGLTVLQELDYRGIEWIVLAGFLRKIPLNIIRGYQDHIINIHPSLLPDFGGKGMYGMHVHRAVVEAKAQKSGISIHLVNEEFDKGRILAQFEIAISQNDTPEQVATKIHTLEQLHFPAIVAQTILNSK
ncbi:MAG: phosphoribosylglycinamide formyltransferase [Fluviicola sp.]|nr:phosphoribosylglycinamide formyltransferase [Fluviicola sp.]